MTPEPPFGRISPDQQAEWDREEAAAQARWEQMDRAEQIKAQIAADESEPDLEPTPESIEQGAEPDDAYRSPEYVADPMNPTDAEMSAAIQRGLANGTLIDAADWLARELAAEDPDPWADTAPDVDDLTEQAEAAAECDARRAGLDAEAELEPEPEASDLGRSEPTPYDLGVSYDPDAPCPAEPTREELERQIAGRDPEAGLGHDYDGPELRSGTPEYEALYAEYQAWVAQPEPEPEAEPGAGPVPYTLTPRAEGVLASWDRFHALERAERVALGEAEPEPEAEL
jgi:hypothetical protein